ncbi:MAG TPA: hypothetical protein VJU60_05170 [Thermoleophilaceae bacterium]|nr:hypothetical protein [Thermoleophilaceae bacterium]
MATLTTPGLDSADEHQRAIRRLEDAMNRQARLTEDYERSMGTQREMDVYLRLREARRQVSAFDKWLHWVDDEDNSNAPPADETPLEEVLGH